MAARASWVAPVTPHPAQQDMIEASLAFMVCVWAVGRRWGKTLGAELLLYIEALRCDRLYKAAYCAPTYKRAREVYDDFVRRWKHLVQYKRDTDLYVELVPFGNNKGAKLWFWSLEAHDNLRGEGLDRVIVDECADVVEAAYYATLMPMLADTGGKALLIGTPKRVGVGFVWFRNEFVRGEDPEDTKTVAGAGPSEGNPHLDVEVLAELRRRQVDPLTLREEFDAEWITEEGAVFQRLDDAFVLDVLRQEGEHLWIGAEPRDDTKYVMGLDLARFEDYTVASVFDRQTRNQVAILRITAEQYDFQMKLIHRLRDRYNKCMIHVDETGVGAPIVEQLARRYGDGVKGKRWSNRSKEEDITRARILFQDGLWRFMSIKWQRSEFQIYTRTKLELSGMWRYSAPAGMHDDCVMAGLLAGEYVALPYIGARQKADDPPYFSIAAIEAREKRTKWRKVFRNLGRTRKRG